MISRRLNSGFSLDLGGSTLEDFGDDSSSPPLDLPLALTLGLRPTDVVLLAVVSVFACLGAGCAGSSSTAFRFLSFKDGIGQSEHLAEGCDTSFCWIKVEGDDSCAWT